jgi:hypothetical protein
MLPDRERMGGSRAQVDLVEATLLRAYLSAGRLEEARHLLANRRPGPAGLPVAGLEQAVARSCNRLFALGWRSRGSAGEPYS